MDAPLGVLGARDTASSATDVVVVSAHGRPAAQEVLVAMEMMHKTNDRIESHVATMQTRIHRFPRGLRGIGGDDDRYIVPSVVAIGPYHHGLPHLQEMEEVTHAAAYHFCRDAGRSPEEVYGSILFLAGDARHCYATEDEAVARLSDAELAAMLFLDGCFLLQYMANSEEPMLAGFNLSSGQAILKDIMLLENQIPWLFLYNRPVRIAAHRFLYKNYKSIATVLSIAGVIVGIFKAILALKLKTG